MSAVKVGQVWRDRDKRRNTVIEIIGTLPEQEKVVGLIVGTEEEREYSVERLTKRWDLVKKAPEPKVIDKAVKEALNRKSAALKDRFKTREQWLTEAVKLITKAVFTPKDIDVPEVRVSVGWPGGRGKKAGVIGQCFASSMAADKVAQVFVSPQLADSTRVLQTLTHELIHAVDDCKDGHKGNFVKVAKVVGFLPKWTSSENLSDDLLDTLKGLAEKLGTYPHAALSGGEEGPKVQKTYMLKVQCPEDNEYFVRMTQTKLDEYGAPLCPCHSSEMILEEK